MWLGWITYFNLVLGYLENNGGDQNRRSLNTEGGGTLEPEKKSGFIIILISINRLGLAPFGRKCIVLRSNNFTFVGHS